MLRHGAPLQDLAPSQPQRHAMLGCDIDHHIGQTFCVAGMPAEKPYEAGVPISECEIMGVGRTFLRVSNRLLGSVL
jgi:hypothetical protein